MATFLTRASAAFDRSVVRFMERRMTRAPRIQQDDAHRKLVEVAELYSAGTHALPSPFFPTPPIAQVVATPAGDGPLGTRIVDLTFPSEYVPFLPATRELYARVPENHTAHVRWWSGGGSGRPTIVLLHGWGGGNPRVTAYAFGVTYWLRHGFDVAAFVLPFHGARAPGSSGALFPSRDPRRTNEGFGQAIFDLRALAMFLRARGSSAVGAIGMSLGGYTTALWASVAGPDEVGGLDFAVGMIPAVSFARLMWRLGEHSPTRKQAVTAGITEDLLADAFAVHSPVARPVRLPPERLAVIAGRGDRITPPDHAEELAAHWGVPVEWFAGGHLAQVGRGEAVRTIRRKLRALALPGQTFRG